MKKNVISFLILFFIFMAGCSEKKDVDIKQLSEKFTIIQNEFQKQRKNVKTSQEFTDLSNKRTEDLEDLLDECESGPDRDDFKVLQSKILIQLSKFDRAEKVINPLLSRETEYINEAKMVKIQILFTKKKFDQAFEIFKKIEASLKPSLDLLLAYRFFGLMLKDDKLKEEYSQKFLNSKNFPAELSRLKGQVLANLGLLDLKKKKYSEAKEKFGQALSFAANPFEARIIQSLLSQMDFLGKPAFPISAETWINSGPVYIQNLKGRVVLIDFWATWCLPCRDVTRVLTELSQEYSRKELIVIGYTKLYGTYRDEIENKGKVNKEEETALIRKYVQRNKISYPIAISTQGEGQKKYIVSALPSTVFINKKGEIAFIKTGADQPQFIKEKVRELLESDQ